MMIPIQQLDTNGVVQFILPAKQAAWHGITWLHVTVMSIAAWAAHANWEQLGKAYRWLGSEGGIGGVLRTIFVGGKPTAALSRDAATNEKEKT